MSRFVYFLFSFVEISVLKQRLSWLDDESTNHKFLIFDRQTAQIIHPLLICHPILKYMYVFAAILHFQSIQKTHTRNIPTKQTTCPKKHAMSKKNLMQLGSVRLAETHMVIYLNA